MKKMNPFQFIHSRYYHKAIGEYVGWQSRKWPVAEYQIYWPPGKVIETFQKTKSGSIQPFQLNPALPDFNEVV